MFVKEITMSMQNILRRSPDPRHQEDANQRDKKLQEEIQLGRVRLLQRPKETPQEPTAMPPSHKHQPWTPKRIERHTERLTMWTVYRRWMMNCKGRLQFPTHYQDGPIASELQASLQWIYTALEQ